MTVRYNGSANRALNHLGKNDKARSKSLAKVASGMKINSAADDASNFSISSRMRVKLRALDQDAQNVQNGRAILRTAEGGIQGQIDLLRTIRAKVLDAANDSNTDDDRQTIQKELRHLYEQMENLAYDTDYNSKKPLLADKIVRLNEGDREEINRTKLNLIRDAKYDILDNVYGPFAVFTEYSSATETLGTTTGYVAATPQVTSLDFSSYTDADRLNNVGLNVDGRVYVFTDDTSKDYRGTKISLGSTVDETIDNLVRTLGAARDGMKVIVSDSVSGASDSGGTVTTSIPIPHSGTGAGVSGTTEGGVTNLTGDADLPAAAKATLTVNLSGATSGTGFRFDGINFRVIDSGASVEGTVDKTLTKGENSNASTRSFDYTFDGSNLTFTAKENGAGYNGYRITNGYTYYTYTDRTTTYTAFGGAIEIVSAGTSMIPATWDLNLSGMSVDDFSAEYAGKIFRFGSSSYKFYDSSVAPKLEGFAEDEGSRASFPTQIDINDIRRSIEGGSTLAQTVAGKIGGTVDGDNVTFSNNYNGAQINLTTETLRHYDVNFSSLNVKIPDALYGKGFRAYCATDNREWFNFIFTDGTNSYDTEKNNIKSITINVSAVTNVEQLIGEIYTQGNAFLTGTDPKFNHHMRLAVDLDNKIVTLYDHRRFDVSNSPYNYQEQGTKIADGISFKEEYERERRNFSVKDLVIQHTDRADMNIHIKIPQMTLDHIFDPLPVVGKTIFDYPVTNKDSRDALLGKPIPPGILDIGLQYLLDAATFVGAQNKRLEFTAENITTETENLTASESVIRDADMAKEVTEYTKQNILSQAAQYMLAQANQLHSSILSLLG